MKKQVVIERKKKWRLPSKPEISLLRQVDAISSVTPENHEQERNKRADCKTNSTREPVNSPNENAVPAGPRNGAAFGNAYEVKAEAGYHAPASPATHAARWYAENRETCPRPVVPALRSMFGLSALQAVQAIREANGGGL